MRHFSPWKPSSVFISQKIFPGGDGASSGRAAMTSPGRETGSGHRARPAPSPRACGWSLPTTAWRRTVWSGASVRPGRGWSARPAATISATSVSSDTSHTFSLPDLSQISIFSIRVPYLISYYLEINICYVENIFIIKIFIDRDRTRTCNPQLRKLVPSPLGHTV